MYRYFKIFSITFISLFLFSTFQAFSGSTFLLSFPDTDTSEDKLAAFFDLRERETFIQITNTGTDLNPGDDDDDNDPEPTGNVTVHVQIFNVDNNCNENNFFDEYTETDTHVYNMRDIQTNNGNPSGVVLPDGAYGIVVVSALADNGDLEESTDSFIGNIRILDNAGYEYRTNITSDPVNLDSNNNFARDVTFNFNTVGGVTLSDVIGFNFIKRESEGEVEVADILDINAGFSIDIFNINEVPQSCRNVIFACVDQDNPLLEGLLEEVAGGNFSANVASFEYGINNAIPHSRGGELLCPGNITSEGFVNMRFETFKDSNEEFVGYIGLNNGNGRGTLDSFWFQNGAFPNGQD